MALEPTFKVDANRTKSLYKDTLRQLVYGYASVAFNSKGDQIQDLHEDLIDKAELDEAAVLFNLEFRKSGVMHQGETKGHLVESFFYDEEKLRVMKLSRDEGAPEVAWWVGFYIPDREVFNKVLDGSLNMFSIQGRGQRVAA